MTIQAELQERIFSRLFEELEIVRNRGLDRLDGADKLPPLGGAEYDENDAVPFVDGTRPSGRDAIPLLTALARDYAEMRGHGRDRRWEKIRFLVAEAKSRIRVGGRMMYLDAFAMETEQLVERITALYGLADDGSGPGQRPLQLMHALREIHHYDHRRTFSRHNETARRHLADAILYAYTDEVEAAEDRAAVDAYVPRTQHEGQFGSYVAEGTGRIVFVGFPGMGKTSLARACAANLGNRVPEIRIEAGRIWTESLRRALAVCGHEITGTLAGHESEYLAELLSGPHSPQFVLLDNLENSDQLARLLLPGTTARVIATCRVRGERRLDSCRFITVGRMADSEAEQMIRDRLPRLSRRQAAYLASELEGYPLVIRYACTLLRNQDVGLDEFCQQIRADAAEIARQARTEEGSTLLAVLRRLVAQIQKRDEYAFELLAFISLIRSTSTIDARVLRHYGEWVWEREDLRRHEPSSTFSPLAYAQAIATLRDFAVIDQVLASTVWSPAGQRTETYSVHPLSQQILRTVMRGEGRKVVIQSTMLLVALFKGVLPRWRSLRGNDRLDEFTVVLATVAELVAPMIIDVEPKGDYLKGFLERYDWIEPVVAGTLISLMADTFENDSEFRADHIPVRWYEWAKATVAARSDFFEDSYDGDEFRNDILQSVRVIEGGRKAVEQ